MSKLASLLCERPDVRLAVVYGSCARGDDRPESDLDLLVSFASEEASPSLLRLLGADFLGGEGLHDCVVKQSV
jgi:predicted nucleotidyltransferase